MFTALAEQDVLAARVPLSLSSPPTVSGAISYPRTFANQYTDAKQARDLVGVLTESKQQIDPRLAEMARYGGGGGGGGRGYRGGRGGGRGGGFTASNAAPLGRSRW